MMYTTKGPTSENAKDRDKNHMEALWKKFSKRKIFLELHGYTMVEQSLHVDCMLTQSKVCWTRY
jgi:hypothetical protein